MIYHLMAYAIFKACPCKDSFCYQDFCYNYFRWLKDSIQFGILETSMVVFLFDKVVHKRELWVQN